MLPAGRDFRITARDHEDIDMTATPNDRRFRWMAIGLIAGLAVAYVWPHEHAAAAVADRNNKFAMVTAQMDATGFVEAVFVLDFLTGQLRGGVVNPTVGQFVYFFTRNVAADFRVDPNTPGTYAIVSGRANPTNSPRVQRGASYLYVAENTSGQVFAYALTMPTEVPGNGPVPLEPATSFQFREAIPK